MKIRKEVGSALLSVLIIIALGVFIILSLRALISGYLLQESVLLQVISDRDVKVEMFQQLVRQEGFWDSLKWETVGLSEGCRLLDGGLRYLESPVGWYGSRLSDECLLGAIREIVGVYSVEGGVAPSVASYAYVVKDREIKLPPRLDGWSVSSLVDGVQVEVVYNAKHYFYFFSGDINVNEVFVLESVMPDGFSLIMENKLWRLPMAGEAPYVVAVLSLSGDEILADLINIEGVYLLQLSPSKIKGLSDIYVVFYEMDRDTGAIRGSKRLLVESLKVDAWRLLQVGYFRVFLEVMSEGELILLAMNWQGDAVWGGQYLWRNKEEVVCPLQAEPFKPIDGWVLGCQRSPIFKIDIK